MTRYAHRPPLELRFRWMRLSESKARTGPVWNGRYANRARTPFALERFEQVAHNQLVYRFPKPQPDGSTQLRRTPLERVERPAALIPPPRLHRHRYQGCPIPRSALEAHCLGPAGNPALVRTAASGLSRAVRRALPGVFACGYCHLPNALGRPENSSLAGLPADYIVRQVAEFKSGVRKSSEPVSLPVNLIIAVAKAATDAEVRTAAEYFAALKPRPRIKVEESGRRNAELPEC